MLYSQPFLFHIILTMKLLLSILLIIGCAVALTFEEYVIKFDKTYQTQQERLARKALFETRMTEYQLFNSQNHAYTLGPTRWTDRFQQQISSSLQVKVSTDQYSSNFEPPTGQLKVGASQRVDWRDSNGVTPVKNQGSCGSCWAFSSIGTLQSYFAIKNQTQYDLSEEYVLQCTKNGSTCSGGYTGDALQFLSKYSAPLESDFPYKGMYFTGLGTPVTSGICTTPTTNFPKLYKNTTFSQFVGKNKTFLQSLIQMGPVSALIIADNNFLAYTGNVFSCNYTYSDNLINHAVVIVGYDASQNYYIIKNSWGTSWGMSGFAYVDMDLDCSLNRAVYQIVWGSKLITGLLFIIVIVSMII